MGQIAAVLNKNGENASETAMVMLESFKEGNWEFYGAASWNCVKKSDQIETLKRADLNSPIVAGHAFSPISSLDKPQPLPLDDASMVFEGRLYPQNLRFSDQQVAAGELRQDYEKTAETLVKQCRGDFVCILAERDRIIAFRDPVGVRPLYYGENQDLLELASTRKALLRTGIEESCSFPPGNIAILRPDGFRFKPVKTIVRPRPRHLTLESAATLLEKFIRQSIQEKIQGLDEVAVAFSGGLDSSVVAFLASRSVPAKLIHVSLGNQPETDHARRVAEELDIPLRVFLFNEGDVEKTVPRVISVIEDFDPVRVEVGVPFNWVAKEAAKMDSRVLLAGQAADELFGGYRRYLEQYATGGRSEVEKSMFADVAGLYETNLERDFKICNSHNVELRVPFASLDLMDYVSSLPVEMKIGSDQNSLRKLVLRKAAENMGLPRMVTERPKKAMQYATGVDRAMRKIAKREGLPVKEYLRRIYALRVNEARKDG